MSQKENPNVYWAVIQVTLTPFTSLRALNEYISYSGAEPPYIKSSTEAAMVRYWIVYHIYYALYQLKKLFRYMLKLCHANNN